MALFFLHVIVFVVKKAAGLALVLAAACGGAGGPSSPAADGVRSYVHALRANDPHDAYDMLSSEARKQISFDEFSLQWKQTSGERTWQAIIFYLSRLRWSWSATVRWGAFSERSLAATTTSGSAKRRLRSMSLRSAA